MAETFTYIEHPRLAELDHEGPVTVRATAKKRVESASGIQKFNRRLGLGITTSVGTMWTAYAFAALTLISLPAAITSGSLIIIVAWIAQTFLQLILLPIIIVGQNVIQATNDARAEADHETLTAVHKLTVEVHAINEA